MEVWFPIQIARKTSLEANQSHGKLEFIDLPHEILFFHGRPGILHPPPCLNIKWNSPFAYQRMKRCKVGVVKMQISTYLSGHLPYLFDYKPHPQNQGEILGLNDGHKN